MKLIVGLGNPGKEYKDTRHNTGFIFIDRLAKDHKTKFKLDVKLKCEICDIIINGEKIILIKPQTFMNLSGTSVKLVCNYYNIDVDDILVIHDDLDLEVGKIRFRAHGSSGGHKGIQNIIDNLETDQIKRLKIGIDKVESKYTIDYVLGKFSKEEFSILDIFLDEISNMIDDFCTMTFENFQLLDFSYFFLIITIVISSDCSVSSVKTPMSESIMWI